MAGTKGISYEIPVSEFVTFLMKLNNNYYNKSSDVAGEATFVP